MSRTLGARRLATLVGDFDRAPAYAGLAEALILLIGDGRVGLDVRLPSERDLTTALGVSRTTVTRAYAELRDAGYAEARRGSGTYTRVPQGRERAHDRALRPHDDSPAAYDLDCAAATAPPQVAQAYAAALSDLPAHLGGHGYFPAGLPTLQEAIAAGFTARGLPTEPAQVLITAGSLAATAVVARTLLRAGDRVLVDSPTYPNSAETLRQTGARIVASPLDPAGWDLDAVTATVRQTAPRAALLIPDFQNPTGLLMTAAERERMAATLRTTRTVPIVDEALQPLGLDVAAMPPPFAAYAAEAVTVGSASKAYWGGFRLGWIRAPHALVPRLVETRVALDLGAPVLEQLALAHLLTDAGPVLAHQHARLREQRDRLAAAVRRRLPEWRFRVPPGGLVLWCELPAPLATSLSAEAERRGVIVPPGPVFAPEGGLDRFVRLPYTRPAEELEAAVDLLAEAWAAARERPSARPGQRVLVA